MAGKRGQPKSTIKNEVVRRAQGGMRQRVRGSLGNSMVLRGNELLEALTMPTSSAIHTLGYPLVGGNTTARDSVVFANVSKNFQQFKYLPGTQLHYQPAVGLNTSGTIYVAYIDNPETIADWYLASQTLRLTMIKSSSTVKSFPLWQEFVLPISGTPRQKLFPTDTSVDFTAELDNSKSVQGVFFVGIDGVTAANPGITVGRCYLQQQLQLESLAYPVVS